ncbi:MAG: ribonuclease HII [Rickettsiales bacterium]
MPHLKLELQLAPARVCGVDEAGRGPWAGPVVAAAVMLGAQDRIPSGLNDSKKLKHAAREALFTQLLAANITHGIGIATAEEIDTLNIWGATQLAMCRAVSGLQIAPDIALIDGKLHPKGMACETRPIIGGDGISLSIAAASILAKVTRDRMMAEYAQDYPQYGFEKHVGYGTKQHQEALAAHGPCPLHRTSYAPIRASLKKAAA